MKSEQLMREALLPCPFCDHSILGLEPVSNMQRVKCSGCGASGPLYTDAAPAIARWNRIAAPATQPPAPAGDAVRAKLHTFMNAAAGEGLVLDGQDAAALYIALFPREYADAIAKIDTDTGSPT